LVIPRNRWRWYALLMAPAAALVLFFLIRPMFTGERPIDPVLLRVGPLQVRWYGFLIAFSFIPGYYLAVAEARRKGIDPERLYDFGLLAGIIGFAGARLAYVIQNLRHFLAEPGRIIAVWEGGLSMHGVIIGGLLATVYFARKLGVPFLTFADVVFPALPLGQALGRWGNFFNQELFGYPTDVPWKMYVAPEHRPAPFAAEAFYHPTFLYESLWNLATLGLLLWYRRRPWAREGDVLFLYLATYSLGRFLVEFFRIGTPVAAGLTLAQLVSVLIIAVSSTWLLFRNRQPLKNPPAGR